MNVTYHPETDGLCLSLQERTHLKSDEDKPGIIIDYDEKGNAVDLESLDATWLKG